MSNSVFLPVAGNQSFGVINSSGLGSQSDVINTGNKGNIVTKEQNTLAQLQGSVTPFPYTIAPNNLKIITAYTPDDFIGSPIAPTSGGAGPLFLTNYLQDAVADGVTRCCMYLNNAPNLPRSANGRDPQVAQFTADDDNTIVSIISVTVEKIYTDGVSSYDYSPTGSVTKIITTNEANPPADPNTDNSLSINLLTTTDSAIIGTTVTSARLNLVRGMGASAFVGDARGAAAGNNAFNLLGGATVSGLISTSLARGRLGSGSTANTTTNGVSAASAGVGIHTISQNAADGGAAGGGTVVGASPVLGTLASAPQSIVLGASNNVPGTDQTPPTNVGNPGVGPILGAGCALKVTILYSQT